MIEHILEGFLFGLGFGIALMILKPLIGLLGSVLNKISLWDDI